MASETALEFRQEGITSKGIPEIFPKISCREFPFSFISLPNFRNFQLKFEIRKFISTQSDLRKLSQETEFRTP